MVLLMIPESPKYLIGKERFDEARISLLKIASFNKVFNSQKDIIQNSIYEGENATIGSFQSIRGQ